MIRKYSLPLLTSLLLAACGETGQQVEQSVAPPARPVPASAELIAGRYFYLADAAIFTGCHTGQRWPVAQRAAAADMERAFRDAELAPGDSMVVTVHGEIDVLPGMEEGTELPHLVIYRVEQAPAAIDCPVPVASLHGRRWELTRWHEGDAAIPASSPWLAFREDGRVNGFSGCNRFNGDYQLLNDTLAFGPLALTKMACRQDDMGTERRFLSLLHETTGFVQTGDELTLMAGNRKLATLKGVALP